MTLIQLWLLFILGTQILHFLGTWKLYAKAGRKAWEAAIPVYNAIILMHIIKRPKWWVLLLFIPIINLLMFPIIWIETIRSFGKNSRLDTALVLVTFGLYIYYVSYVDTVTYKEERSLQPQSGMGEFYRICHYCSHHCAHVCYAPLHHSHIFAREVFVGR